MFGAYGRFVDEDLIITKIIVVEEMSSYNAGIQHLNRTSALS